MPKALARPKKLRRDMPRAAVRLSRSMILSSLLVIEQLL
jgi:hypothetical protein